MTLWNSTFKVSAKPLQRKTPMKRANPLKTNHSAESRYGKSHVGKGLAQRVAEIAGTAIKHLRGESGLLRSEQHRRNVAALGCLITGKPAQACHINFDKGMGLKVCDSLCFPLCPELHREHDQGGGMSRMERIKREWQYVDQTRALLIRRNQWPAVVEEHYQRAIMPLARMVHGDDQKDCPASVPADLGAAHNTSEI